MPKRRRESKGKNSPVETGRKSSSSTSRNRNRTASSSSNTRKRKKKDDSTSNDMPDPPASLVRLLGKDEKVLNYFTSLQKNLALDVKRWKDKAMEYKTQLNKLKKEKEIVERKIEARKNERIRDDDVSESIGGDDEEHVPVESIQVPIENENGHGENSSVEDIAEYRKDQCSIDGDSSLSDESILKSTPPKSKERTKSEMEMQLDSPKRKDRVRKQDNVDRSSDSQNDQGEHIDDDGSRQLNGAQIGKDVNQEEDNGDFIDEDFFAELPSSCGSSSSSSSASFGDIERELDEQINSIRGETFTLEEEVESTDLTEEHKIGVRTRVLLLLEEAFDNMEQLGIQFVDIVRQEDNEKDEDDREQECTPIVKDDGNGDVRGEREMEKMKSTSSDDASDHSGDDGFLSSAIYQRSKKEVHSELKEVPEIREISDTHAALKTASRPVITKRTDGDVIRDMMRSLRSLIRKPTLEVGASKYDSFVKASFQPFLTKKFVPACYNIGMEPPSDDDSEVNVPEHPLLSGLQLLLRALSIMDTYCSYNSIFSDTDEWEKLFENNNMSFQDDNMRWEKLQSMYVGMYQRDISRQILISFDGEITRSWAVADRAVRLTPTALVYLDELIDDSSSDDNDGSDEEGGDQGEEIYAFAAKNQNRLFLLLERICIARIASFLHRYRGDLKSASRVVLEYIFSAIPSPKIESYPRFSPTMSMCVLEALLKPDESLSSRESSPESWFTSFLCSVEKGEERVYLKDALKFSIQEGLQIWNKRSGSAERRVKEMAMIEIAAYNRLVETEKEWLAGVLDNKSEMALSNEGIFHEMNSLLSANQISVGYAFSLQLRLTWKGCVSSAIQCFQKVIHALQDLPCEGHSIKSLSLVISSTFSASIAVQHLNWESSCLTGLSMDLVRNDTDVDKKLGAEIDNLVELYSCRNTTSVTLTNTIMRCCIALGDGYRAYKFAQLLCNNHSNSSPAESIQHSGQEQLNTLLRFSDFPVIRVINLVFRDDRWKQITIQAQRSQIFVLRGVASLSDELSKSLPFDDAIEHDLFWGLYAHSGRDTGHLLFEQNVSSKLQEGKNLSDYVQVSWQPGDLKAFDTNARGADAKVRLSVSEKACALSHIASWKGVKNSLLSPVKGSYQVTDYILQHFRISGFARGAPCISQNDDMEPTPVCVILEDDAMLVDQFNDKLGNLLDELPRDFHFCSIGYSRPKNAPLIHYSNHVTIPTCLWYLTGYILSLEGAKYLLDALPVQGPVDSWIGMKITSNWDNEYGYRIGVGGAPKAIVDRDMLPSRKTLGTVMKFRAFAASNPLCSQKLTWKQSSMAERGSARWRDRDTDVTYSGGY